ncbi:MAG: branched-chain amino acid ABC transporter permease [Deltaproteobacteria bacterium]|nr:branched-chain amino acid ABC transporter permease [Deltaproteobacteria bacterium]
MSKSKIRSGKNPVKTFFGLGTLIVLLLAPLFLNNYRLHLANLVLIYVLLTSSLRTIYISGQLSLGHAAFMGIGAYTSAILAKHAGWTPWATIPIGGLSAMVAGILIGFPFSRLRAIYFSMASLFFGIMITALTGVIPDLTGYLGGMPGIPRLFGFSKIPYYYFFLVLTLLCLLVIYRIEHSRIGMTLMGVAQSYLAASSRGINEAGARIQALGIGCFFAGLAGAVYAHYNTFIAPSNFSMLPSIFLVVYLLAGGTGSFAGPIVGAFILYLVPYVMGGLKGYTPFFLAGLLAVVIFLIPKGIVSLPEQISSWIKNKRQQKVPDHAS